MSIYNQQFNLTQNPNSIYSLYSVSGISFTGLVSGSVLGTVSSGTANTGVDHYVDITLNATAISLLNGAQGSTFVFGGSVDEPLDSGNIVALFGFTSGLPEPILTLTEGATVPEPGTWAMLLGSLGTLAFMRRRR